MVIQYEDINSETPKIELFLTKSEAGDLKSFCIDVLDEASKKIKEAAYSELINNEFREEVFSETIMTVHNYNKSNIERCPQYLRPLLERNM